MSDEDARTPRLRVIADTTVEPMAAFLRAPAEPPAASGTRASSCAPLEPFFAPLNQTWQVLFDAEHEIWQQQSDATMIWTTPERLFPAFATLLDFEGIDFDALLADVRQFGERVVQCAAREGLIVLTSWSAPRDQRWAQGLSLQASSPTPGLKHTLMRMNLALAEVLDQSDSVVLLDVDHWYASCEAAIYDPRLFALGKLVFSRELFSVAAREVRAVVSAARGQSRKLVVCDLDNTLWGGVLGDEGVEGVRLGGHDPVGESFVAMQRALQALARRGVVLAIASKNDACHALRAIEEHPEMVLRCGDFVAHRIDWNDKAANVASIAEELKLGLSAIVFVDDNPVERDRVRRALPEVLVPELPADPVEVPYFIAHLDCFEALRVTDEDRVRTTNYLAESERREARELSVDLDSWLASLEISVHARRLDRDDLARAGQLLNKTNQFNAAVERLPAEDLWRWSEAPENLLYTYRVRDRFGAQGLTGLAGVSVQGEAAELQHLVMSCRVIGKRVEDAVIAHIWACARARGASALRCRVEITERNGPVRRFLAARLVNGHSDSEAGGWPLDVAKLKTPQTVTLIDDSADTGGEDVVNA